MANGTVSKRYYAVANNSHCTHIKVEVYYHLGGINYFTYKNEPRGYYLSVSPVERRTSSAGYTMESFTAFTGTKRLILEVQRRSNKSADSAVLRASTMEKELIEYVCANNGIDMSQVNMQEVAK